MKDIFSVDFREAIRRVVKNELKEKFGIKTIKDKEKDKSYDETQNVFGVPLEKVASKNIDTNHYFSVPIFLTDAFEYLNDHLKVEGLFRKSGSVGRQRMLKEIVEREGTCCSCDFAQAHDVASLVKQFFRELPDPLLTSRLSQTFLKCISLTNHNEAISALTLCCLLLPDEHLRVLKYFTKFVNDVANHSLESKMTLSNLSIVFAPNLMSTSGKDKNSEKSMKDITCVVSLLFKHFHLIGMVPDTLYEKACNINTEGGFYSSSGDELDDDVNMRLGRTLARSDKKRDRSKSITGFLKRNFKPGETKTTTPKHLRTKSEAHRMSFRKKNSVGSIPCESDNIVDGPMKRKTSQPHNATPLRKSPRLHSKEQVCPVISKPVLKGGMSNHVAVTPRRYLKPIQANDLEGNFKECSKTPVLPSKFEISRSNTEKRESLSKSKVNLNRSKSTYAGNRNPSSSAMVNNESLDDSALSQIQYRDEDGKTFHSKLSRTTQKPHVRKSRRASSLDRRRARLASQRVTRKLPKTPTDIEPTPEQKLTRKSVDNETIGANAAFVESDGTVTPTSPIEICRESKKAYEEAENKKQLPIKPVRRKKSGTQRSVTRKPSSEKNQTLPVKHTYSSFRSSKEVMPNENNAATPHCVRRSATTASSRKKPPTPYNVTPQVGVRKKRPVIGNV